MHPTRRTFNNGLSQQVYYRDLRIELSRKEFEDFAGTFKLQSDKLLEIVERTNYQDGMTADANREEHKIWTKSKLEQEIVYNPQRVSLEECTDGYHLHYRNCNLLLDEKGFRALKQAFASADTDTPVASTFEELIELLKINRIRHWLPIGNKRVGSRKVHRIAVAKYDISKISAIFAGIGMEGRLTAEGTTYSKNGLAIELITAKNVPPESATPEPTNITS